MAGAGSVLYVVWRAACRLAARLIRKNPASPAVRAIANGVFVGALLLIVLQPYRFPMRPVVVTIHLPKKEAAPPVR